VLAVPAVPDMRCESTETVARRRIDAGHRSDRTEMRRELTETVAARRTDAGRMGGLQ
jgi:hypothetical protein